MIFIVLIVKTKRSISSLMELINGNLSTLLKSLLNIKVQLLTSLWNLYQQIKLQTKHSKGASVAQLWGALIVTNEWFVLTYS